MSNPYTILSVPQDADLPTIKKAYHKLCLLHHPDKQKDPAQKNSATDRFQQIQQAYEILSDDDKRAKYDFFLKRGYGRQGDEPPEGVHRQQSPGREAYEGRKHRYEDDYRSQSRSRERGRRYETRRPRYYSPSRSRSRSRGPRHEERRSRYHSPSPPPGRGRYDTYHTCHSPRPTRSPSPPPGRRYEERRPWFDSANPRYEERRPRHETSRSEARRDLVEGLPPGKYKVTYEIHSPGGGVRYETEKVEVRAPGEERRPWYDAHSRRTLDSSPLRDHFSSSPWYETRASRFGGSSPRYEERSPRFDRRRRH